MKTKIKQQKKHGGATQMGPGLALVAVHYLPSTGSGSNAYSMTVKTRLFSVRNPLVAWGDV